jgi:hypothetical protein
MATGEGFHTVPPLPHLPEAAECWRLPHLEELQQSDPPSLGLEGSRETVPDVSGASGATSWPGMSNFPRPKCGRRAPFPKAGLQVGGWRRDCLLQKEVTRTSKGAI